MINQRTGREIVSPADKAGLRPNRFCRNTAGDFVEFCQRKYDVELTPKQRDVVDALFAMPPLFGPAHGSGKTTLIALLYAYDPHTEETLSSICSAPRR